MENTPAMTLFRHFKQALGLGELPLQRLVIELDCKLGVPRVYAQGVVVSQEMIDALVGIELVPCAVVAVSENGQVTHEKASPAVPDEGDNFVLCPACGNTRRNHPGCTFALCRKEDPKKFAKPRDRTYSP